jgi:hypothetical protein
MELGLAFELDLKVSNLERCAIFEMKKYKNLKN